MSYLNEGPLVLCSDGLLRIATTEQRARFEPTPFPETQGVYRDDGKPLGAIHAVIKTDKSQEVTIHVSNMPYPAVITLRRATVG